MDYREGKLRGNWEEGWREIQTERKNSPIDGREEEEEVV